MLSWFHMDQTWWKVTKEAVRLARLCKEENREMVRQCRLSRFGSLKSNPQYEWSELESMCTECDDNRFLYKGIPWPTVSEIGGAIVTVAVNDVGVQHLQQNQNFYDLRDDLLEPCSQ